MSPPPANPGWYPSKQRPGQSRYWDGKDWTDAYRPESNGVEDTAGEVPPDAPAPGATGPATVVHDRTMRRVWIGAGVAVIVAAVAVAIAFWPSTRDLDTTKVEADIETTFHENGGPRVSVDCPDSMPVKAGAEYHCIVTDTEGNTLRVTVSVENDDGDITWTSG